MDKSQSNQYYASAPPQIVMANVYVPAQTVDMPPPRYPGACPDPIMADSCFNRAQKNKPQANTLASSGLIFLTGGLNIAFSLGFNTVYGVQLDLLTCWFIAVIIGCVLGAFITPKIPKKFIVLFSSVLVLIEGILFLAFYDEYNGIMAARYLNGIGVGLIYAATFALIGENTVPERRGMLAASTESMMFTAGILLQVIYTTSTDEYRSVSAETAHGILSTVCGMVALIWSFFIIESPVYYLVRGQEPEAIASVIRLQQPYVLTFSKCDRIDEYKSYIAMNKEMSFQECVVRGLPSLLKLSLLRGLIAMSYTSITILTITLGSITQVSYWPQILGAGLRFFAAVCSGSSIDAAGRKAYLWFGTLLAAGMCLGLGIIFGDWTNLLLSSQRNIIIGISMVALFCSGYTYSALSTYTAEAFPLAIKPYFTSLTFIVEMLVQIIILNCKFQTESITQFYFANFGLLFFTFVASIWLLPESKKMTLRQAQVKFQSLIAI